VIDSHWFHPTAPSTLLTKNGELSSSSSSQCTRGVVPLTRSLIIRLPFVYSDSIEDEMKFIETLHMSQTNFMAPSIIVVVVLLVFAAAF
jgi:hypothetical protein